MTIDVMQFVAIGAATSLTAMLGFALGSRRSCKRCWQEGWDERSEVARKSEPEIEWNVVLDHMEKKLPLGDLVYFCIKEDMIAARVLKHSVEEDRNGKAVITTSMTFVSPEEMIDLTNEQIDAVAEYLRETDQAQKFSKKLEEYD